MPVSLPPKRGTGLFNPNDWYWISTDQRVYSSKRNALVYLYDPGYLAFVAKFGAATPWPKDINGNQTNQALQDALAAYGITVVIPTFTVA